jgi:hypothetical protein
MPRDGSGTYSVPNTFLPNTVMSATAVNANFTDAGTALTGSLARDGQSVMTGQFKAIAGTVGAPGISFGVDVNTGFRRASEDEMRWVTGGVDRFYIDSVGKAFQLGDMDIAGQIGLAAPVIIATTSASLLTLRRTENDTTARIVEEWQSGTGAGAKGTLEVVGDGNNSVAMLRWRVNSVAVFQATSALFTTNVPFQVGLSLTMNTAGYIDMAEVTEPATPASGQVRLYAADVSGTTKLQFKDDTGTVTTLPRGSDRQVFTAGGTWNKPAGVTVVFVQCWGGGGSGGRGGAGDGGGGGGGGAYAEKYIAISSVSAAVSITVGAGGAAQTADDTAGNQGADSSFGAYLTAFGGGAGAGSSSAGGGGGGGLLAAGGNASTSTGASGGVPLGIIGSETTGAAGNANPFGGGGGASASTNGGTAIYGGGGGGFGSNASAPTVGGDSIFGGGGGGGGADTSGGAAPGTGIVYGGTGGGGQTGATPGNSGSAPGGGGGGSESANSGAGARGEVRVTCW